MTKEESLIQLKEFEEYFQDRIEKETHVLFDKEQAKKDLEAIRMAIRALEQEHCEDCISRQAAIDAFNAFADEVNQDTDIHEAIEIVLNLPPVTPAEKVGRWVLIQRDKYIDINCSECGNTRIKEYAYNYTVDEIDMQEIKDLAVTNKMNYCECCGAKMEVKE